MNQVIKHNAKTIYIDHPGASYGIFCFNDAGDLFLNSDWGMYGYAWRSFGESFETFLAQTNEDYIVGKFEINYCEVSGKRNMPPRKRKNLLLLVGAFIDAIKPRSVKGILEGDKKEVL